MSLGKKLLIGLGSLVSFGTIIASSSAPSVNTTTSPSIVQSAAVLSAHDTTNTPAPTVSAPASTPVPTPVPAPTPRQTIVPTGSGYTNVDGVHVASPVQADTPPAGATARCGDRTYSFSLHHSGTCSHHGGVASWL